MLKIKEISREGSIIASSEVFKVTAYRTFHVLKLSASYPFYIIYINNIPRFKPPKEASLPLILPNLYNNVI